MGAEHSQQRLATDGSEFFSGIGDRSNEAPASIGQSEIDPTQNRRPLLMRSQTTLSGSSINVNRLRNSSSATRTTNPPSGNSGTELARISSSPPLSVCSDLPYVSYTANKPIGGDSPKMRGLRSHASAGGGGKEGGTVSNIAQRSSLVLRRPTAVLGARPKRPQTTGGLSDIVIVKPNTTSEQEDVEPELQQLQNIPQFMPVLRDSLLSTWNFSKDTEILERFKMEPHVLNICTRLQHHFHQSASQVALEQSRLVEKTKVISNTSTRIFASLVDMQKTYASYAEHLAKVRLISEDLERCQNLIKDNMARLEELNDYLPSELRLPAFNVWLEEEMDDGETTKERRSEADGASTSRKSVPKLPTSSGRPTTS